MRYDQQIHDHRVLDSDPGATERNVQYADIALQRAAQRNGGQNPPASAPQSVTSADVVATRATDTTLSWGRSGEIEATGEPAPAPSGSAPVRSHGGDGNANMESIINGTNFGG